VGVLAALGVASFLWDFGWPGWGAWAVLMLILGTDHPPVLVPEEQLDPVRRRVGVFSLFIFVVTFIPTPIRFL